MSSRIHRVVTLASGSPRRVELLRQIGVRHVVRPSDIDERPRAGEAAEPYVQRLAREKAEVGWRADPSRPVLAADTVVVLDGELYGKPSDRSEARRMLSALAGRTHHVLTAVALRSAAGVSAALSASVVSFAALDAATLERYLDTGEPFGKAGGYGIQGFAAAFVTRLEGSYSGVMGLPLAEAAALLSAAGVAVWNGENEP